MKKALSLLLIFACLLPLVACTPHVHEFQLSETDSKAVTCTAAGLEVLVCSCGEKQETPIEATGHDFQLTMEKKPTCTGNGSTDYKCTKCGKIFHMQNKSAEGALKAALQSSNFEIDSRRTVLYGLCCGCN